MGPKWESSLEDCRGTEFPMSLASKWMDWVVCYLDSPGRQQWAESHEEAVDTNHTSLGSETLPNPFALEIPFSSSLKGEYQAIDICVPWTFFISTSVHHLSSGRLLPPVPISFTNSNSTQIPRTHSPVSIFKKPSPSLREKWLLPSKFLTF